MIYMTIAIATSIAVGITFNHALQSGGTCFVFILVTITVNGLLKARMRWKGDHIPYTIMNVAISQRSYTKHSLSKTRAKFTVEEIEIEDRKPIECVHANRTGRLVLDDHRRLRAEEYVVESIDDPLVGSDWYALVAAVRSVKNSVTPEQSHEATTTSIDTVGFTHSIDCPFVECDAIVESWVHLKF